MDATTLSFPDTVRIHHATKTKALNLATMLAAEYPALTLGWTLNEDASKVVGWNVIHAMDTENANQIYLGDKVPDLAELIDTCEEEGLDPTEGADEEDDDKPTGSVVSETYRALYKEVSENGQTCGDWLAEFLINVTHNDKGFQVEDFTHLLQLNGVSFAGKWASLPESGQPGWVGRYRMNGRQILEKVVAKRGTCFDGLGQEFTVPEQDLERLRTKHAKWLAKEAKREAAEAKAEPTEVNHNGEPVDGQTASDNEAIADAVAAAHMTA